MYKLALDVLDVQARASVADMLYLVDKATLQLSDEQKAKVENAMSLLSRWDYRFDSDSSAASIFHAWEIQIGYFLHETKIESPVARMMLSYGGNNIGQFMWVSIKEWADF